MSPSPPKSDAGAPPRTERETLPLTPWWYWAVPRVALVAAMAAVGALLWLLHRADLEEQRATLISDVLWVEQNLRFHLG